MPVSAIARAQPVIVASIESSASTDSGGSSPTRSTSVRANQLSGIPAGVTRVRTPRPARTAAIVAGSSSPVVRWTVAR